MATTPKTTMKRSVLVKLTQGELIERGQDLVAKVQLHAAVDEERKAAGKKFRDRMKEIAREGKELCRVISDRTERREVEVIAEPDYRKGVMLYKLPKTGEVVDERELAPHEFQTSIEDRVTDPAPKAGKAKGKAKPEDAISAPPAKEKKAATVSHLRPVPAETATAAGATEPEAG